MYVDVNQQNIDFTLDTGSEVTILTEQSARDLKLNLVKPSRLLVGADASPLDVTGECLLDL